MGSLVSSIDTYSQYTHVIITASLHLLFIFIDYTVAGRCSAE